MWRLILAAIVVSALAGAGALPAAAFDYQEPTVPTGFLLAQPGAAPTIAVPGGIGPTFMFRLAIEDVPTAATVPSIASSSGTAPQPSVSVVPDLEGGGWALWYWTR